jgi:hypothetical protein
VSVLWACSSRVKYLSREPPKHTNRFRKLVYRNHNVELIAGSTGPLWPLAWVDIRDANDSGRDCLFAKGSNDDLLVVNCRTGK